jgi:hypothetical protein
VCYYRNPESRAKRLQKAVQMMMGSAERQAARRGTEDFLE